LKTRLPSSRSWRAALERKGYKVANASSGQDGLDLLKTGKYGGVISDIRMPGTVKRARKFTPGFKSIGPDLASRNYFDQRRYREQRNTVFVAPQRNTVH